MVSGDDLAAVEKYASAAIAKATDSLAAAGAALARKASGLRRCPPVPGAQIVEGNDIRAGMGPELASVAEQLVARGHEVRVQTALRAPPPPSRKSVLGRFFGVLVDPHTYGSLFYMLLALATGIFYFTWVTTGAGLSLGLAILIIGIPFVILFIGATRILALVEGRIVEVMLGERMPRRPLYNDRNLPLLQRIGAMFTDPRTWGTMLYFLLMMPLGTLYLPLAVVGLSLSAAFIAVPFLTLFGFADHVLVWNDVSLVDARWAAVVLPVLGVVLLFVTLHLARFIGHMHGKLAKQLLVSNRAY
jgi:hypothetical protein